MTDHAEWQPIDPPDVSHLVTEDDAPVDNLFQEKQMRLLVEPLYSSFRPTAEDGTPRPFLAAADVGVFGSIHEKAVVPDMLLSMDVSVPDEFWRKDKRSYYVWEFGKPADVAIEIVSNREGGELDIKRALYSRLRIAHYVVFDHLQTLGEEDLYVFEMKGDLLVPAAAATFPTLGLGLVRWRGRFETKVASWLRWCFPDGTLVPTGEERAEQASLRAEQESRRAEQESRRAEQESRRADRLAAQLRRLGVDPEG